jgi:hypothetical protein
MTDEQLALYEEYAADPRVQTNDDGTVTVTIEPVDYRGVTYTEIVLRKAKGRDWERTDGAKGVVGQGLQLAASVSGVPLAVFHEMDGEDAILCSNLAALVGKKSRTGGKSSAI